jgi:Na+-driven multidrug efflux pump
MSVLMMGVLLLMRRPLLSLFAVGPEVEDLTLKILGVLIIVFIPKMLNTIIVVGILRSGGDTKWCLFIDTSGVWLVGVPLAFLGALVWHLPVYIVYFLVCIEEIYKSVFGLWRVKRKKWLRNIAIEVDQ